MPQRQTGSDGDERAFDHALERAAEGIIEAQGVPLSSDQLRRLIEAAPNDPERPGRRQLERADFAGATFSGDANFRGTTFAGPADFSDATFSGTADFLGVAFAGDANFNFATFTGFAGFDETRFEGDAHFRQATISNANFREANFAGHTHFDKATFGPDANFRGATFRDAHFPEATFERNAHFEGATFEQAREFGPMLVFERLSLDRAVFAERVRIEASARRASFARARFRAGAHVRLRWAEVWLEDTDFAEPSLVAALHARLRPEGDKTFLGWERREDDGTWRCLIDEPKDYHPHVLSVRGATVASLTLSGVNLKECRFAGAFGLDELRLERVQFAPPPDGLRWTRRETVAEEQHWRARTGHGSGWNQGELPSSTPGTPPWPPEEPPRLEPDQIARTYRALRKGFEDSKDAPGAGDFYYGEMEMRRHSGPFWERFIVWLYWLVSGYGLRASRALLWLAVTIAVLAIPLMLWGFRPDRPYGRAVLFSLESSISLLRPPDAKLTAGGEVIQIVLRLAGPLFFGLALLALRGRVKR